MNVRLTSVLFLFYPCMIMVSPEEGERHHDEEITENISYNYRQLKNQNELVQVRDNMEVTEIKDLPKVLLDERTFEKFPVQEDGYIKWIRIAESISQNSHRKKFGVLLLGIEKVYDVNNVVEENPDLACEMILLKWLAMEGTKTEPITFQTLINVIHELGEIFGDDDYGSLANKLASTVEAHQTMDTDYIPALAREYSSKLLEKYQRDYVINSSQWLPKMLDRNITFVELEMKEDSNNNVTLDDLLHDIQDGMRILFTGRPGVGKTTISRHLSKYIPVHMEQFFLIIKLHLGELNDPITNLNALLEVHVKSLHQDKIEFISNFIRRTSGRGVCFLLDGYDEYAPSRHGNYINMLVTGNELTKSVVIVTSRPSTVKDIKFLFQRNIEIIGFGEHEIDTYLKQLQLPDAQNTLIYQYLENHPNVKQMCYLPLHLSMLVYVAVITTDSSTLTLIDTETQLYNHFLALTIKQYEKVRHERAVQSLKKCFSDTDTQTDLCNILLNISKIAFDGLNNRTQMFTSLSLTGLSKIANVSSEIEALSLFKIETSYDKDGITFFKYSYSHPTFQEFLAALHLTTLSKEIQLSYSKHSWMHEVYKYYFGLIRSMSKYHHVTRTHMFISFAKEDLATYQNQELYIMKCAHEATDNSFQYIFYLQAAGVISQDNSIHAKVDYHSYDCWYLGYVLAQTSIHELTISKFSDVALCLSFITKYLKNGARTAGTPNVTKLAIGDDSFWAWFTDEEDPIDIVEIIEFLSVFPKSPTHVELRYLKFEQAYSVLQLGEFLKSFNILQSLALSVNHSIIKEGHLEKALQDLTHLRHLELGVINKHDDDTVISDDLLEFRNLNQLQSLTLYISWNKEIVDVNTTALLGGLKHLNNLETLTVWLILYAGFRNGGANELLLGIQEVYNIRNLTLSLDLCWDEGIGNTSIKELSEALSSLRMFLIRLTLCISFSFSGIHGHVGVFELANGLKTLTDLQDLRLELRWEMQVNDSIDEGALALADGLKHLHKLHTLELNLQHNGSVNKIMTIFPSLTCLQSLSLKWTSPGGLIGQTDVKKLLYELNSLTHLQKLDLSWNTIGDDDMKSLTEALKEMNNLNTLDLSRNEIGDDGIKMLAELFDFTKQYLCNLQVLILSFNKFSKTGAKLLAKKLKDLPQLDTLEFDLELGAYSAEVMSLRWQDDGMSQETLPLYSIFFITVFQEHYYSAILGIVVVIGVCSCFKLMIGKKVAQPSEVSIALSHSSFSVSTAWNLKRLDNLILNGTGTVIVILDTTIDPTYARLIRKKIPIYDFLCHMPVTSTTHGTICSAIAVGLPTSEILPRGVAPGASQIVYRIADGECCYNDALLKALEDIK